MQKVCAYNEKVFIAELKLEFNQITCPCRKLKNKRHAMYKLVKWLVIKKYYRGSANPSDTYQFKTYQYIYTSD